jgi:hypothetical protein
VLHDIVGTGDALLFEIMLCSAPVNYDFSPARTVEKNLGSGVARIEDGETVALHLRAALWKKLLVDQLLEDFEPVTM